MIRNRGLHRDAAVKCVLSGEIDMSTATLQESLVLFDPDRDIKIEDIELVFTVAGDTGSVQPVFVGTAADDDHYASFSHTATVAATAKGIGEKATLLNRTDLLARGTGLFVKRGNTTAATNTSAFKVAVYYRYVDRLR